MGLAAQKTEQIELPPKLVPVFAPERGSVRYRGAYGGRGSGKSFSFALMASIFGFAESLRILCTREFQVSIRESFHAELRAAIATRPWLERFYDVGADYIRGANGTEFIFRGLRRNMQSIKSTAGIDIAIIEEAEDAPELSWRDLEPTIRVPKSEIWAVWNPRTQGSPVDARFVADTPDDAVIAELNWHDNPWFPDVLNETRKRDQERLDPATYAHIWEGSYLENSRSQVLHDKVRVAEFDPDWDNWAGPYHGLDYGFAVDPTAAIRSWINDDILYVDAEAGGVGIELDDTPAVVKNAMPSAENHVIRADAARPESTSHVRRHGLPRAESAPKWQGSVEDGIEHLRSYREIVVHPRCRNFIRETRLYSYKVDQHTGDVLPKIVDQHNHWIDALRYALAPLIKKPNRWRPL